MNRGLLSSSPTSLTLGCGLSMTLPLGWDGKEGDGPDRTPLPSTSALSSFQEACLHSCAGKLIHSNHRLMAAYVQLMPALVQRRIADYEAASAVPGVAAEQPGNSPAGS